MNRTPDFIVKPDFQTLRDVIVTAQTEAAAKYLSTEIGKKMYYDIPGWKATEKQVKSMGFTVQRTA